MNCRIPNQDIRDLTLEEVSTIVIALAHFAPGGREIATKHIRPDLGDARPLNPAMVEALIEKINLPSRQPVDIGGTMIYRPLHPSAASAGEIGHAWQYVVVLGPADGPDGQGRTRFRIRAGDGWETFATRAELTDKNSPARPPHRLTLVKA
jgi:uncharacterized protein YneF (UPF0154 family)